MTMIQAVESFLIEQQLKGNTEKTVDGYRGFLRRFVAYMSEQGITDMGTLTIDHINKYQLYIDRKVCERGRNGKLTKRSIQTYMRHIKVFVRYCYEQEIISEALHDKMKTPKAERPVIEILTDAEVDILLSCFSKKSETGLRNTAIVCLMLDCGLRLEEVTRIKKEDINFEKGYVTVMGKGRKGRIVPLGLKMRRALLNYVHKRRSADSPDDDQYFFMSNERRPIKTDTISNLMNRLKKRTGIRRLHAHLLRHTFATNYIVHGIGDVYELSRLLGHATLNITERYLQLASYYTIMEKRRRKSYLDLIT